MKRFLKKSREIDYRIYPPNRLQKTQTEASINLNFKTPLKNFIEIFEISGLSDKDSERQVRVHTKIRGINILERIKKPLKDRDSSQN